MAKEMLTIEQIFRDIKSKKYAPIYYLMGEESYYIDLIANYIEESVLSPEEKEFNQTIIYGTSVTSYTDIITAAKRYPMMSDYQVIIVREAQQIKDDISKLNYYLEHIQPTTILVFCHKYGKIDKRMKTLVAAIKSKGVLFESEPLKEKNLLPFVTTYLTKKGYTIEPKAAEIVANYIGTDLVRLTADLDKLAIAMNTEKRITPAHIEHNIGISKNYNYFELQNAILDRDVLKANQIVNYFADNTKANPLTLILSLLFKYFSNLMMAYYAPQKNERGIQDMLDLRFDWQARDYMRGMQQFSGIKTMDIIGYIRDADVRSKGFGDTATTSDGDLLRELIYKIMH